jgi:hypothetical protein
MALIIFVVLAMGKTSWAFFSYMTVPLDASISIALFADTLIERSVAETSSAIAQNRMHVASANATQRCADFFDIFKV